MSIGREIASDLLKRFPNAATKTLALKAYKENPAVWPTVEAARSAFRYLRGAVGSRNRKACGSKEHYRELQRAGDPFDALPDGWDEMPDWAAVQIDGPMRALVLSDIHIPYHSKPELVRALKFGSERKANLILLNGDTADFFRISHWQKDPRGRNFAEELKLVGEFLSLVRSMFPKARIVFKKGNHEERWDSYMQCKAPELLDIPEFQFDRVLKFDELGIQLVGDMRPIKLGKLNVLHGHEYRFAISNPVNPARGFFLRAKVHCLGGHLHQTSQHSETNLDGTVISTWSTGCLCNLHPRYRPINNWNHGFAFVEVAASGAFQVQNMRLINGEIY